jgi:hypothetical protein
MSTEVKPGERCVVNGRHGEYGSLFSQGWVYFDGDATPTLVDSTRILPEPKPLIHVEFTEEEVSRVLDNAIECKACDHLGCLLRRKIREAMA